MRFLSVAIASFFLVHSIDSVQAMSRAPDGYTLVLVPDQYGVVQITNDLSQQYPVVMASYELPGDAANPNIHVFQGGQWMHISNESFASGSFLKVRPARTIVVGNDDNLTAALLNSTRAWNGQQVLNIPNGTSTELINWYGKYFDFGKREWRWFGDKYKLSLIEENVTREKESWYDRPYKDETRGEGYIENPRAAPRTTTLAPVAPATGKAAQPRSASFQSSTPPAAAPKATPAVKPAVKPVVVKPVAPAPVDPAPSELPATPAAEAVPSIPLKNDNKPSFQGWIKPDTSAAPADGSTAPSSP